MNLKEAALRAAVIKRLKELLDEADKEGRTETLSLFLEAHQALGVKSVDITLPTGEKIATATLPAPRPKVDVDEGAFLEWVRREHPEELVVEVRESFRRALLKDLVAVDDQVVNKKTGEVVPWASVRPAAEPSSFTVRFTPAGREAIEEAWRSGQLGLLEYVAPRQLEAGGDAA